MIRDTSLTRERTLKMLSRFDDATATDIAHALNIHNVNRHRSVWRHLRELVDAGLAERDGGFKTQARYRITVAGRARLAGAA